MASTAETRSAEEIEYEEMRSAMEIEIKNRGAPYKYGWVVPYLQKFSLEDEEHVSDSEYYSSSDSDCDERPLWLKLIHNSRLTNAHEVVKRFLKQVRESNGYDVDCTPPRRFCSPFAPEDPEFKGEPFRTNLMRATHFAIDKINVETGKNYKLVKVEKVVTVNFMFLLTLTVMEDDAAVDASLKTLRAMVKVPYSPKADLTLEEWMYKAPSPAIGEQGEGVLGVGFVSELTRGVEAGFVDAESAVGFSATVR